MNLDEEDLVTISPSYFWSCITLSDDCPFFCNTDPKLHFFGFGIAALYGAFIFIILSDLGFYWSLDDMQQQIEYYMNLITSKVKRVQMDQRKLITIQERTERQLRKTRNCSRMITCLRGALCAGDPQALNLVTSFELGNAAEDHEWMSVKNFGDY